jgi:hypothetical protein
LCRDVAGGMSEHAAWVAAGNKGRNGSRFFKRPEVAARVAELRQEFNERSAIALSYLQEQLLQLLKADIGNYLEKRPYSNRLHVRDLTQLSPELRACISEVTFGKGGEINIKVHDKLKVMDTLLRSMGIGIDSATANVQIAQIERVIVDRPTPVAQASPKQIDGVASAADRIAALANPKLKELIP